MARIGGIDVAITASYAGFTKGTKGAIKQLGVFNKAVVDSITGVKGLTAVLGATGAVGGFVVMTKRAMGAVAALDSLSAKLGVSTTEIKGLTMAAEEAGVSAETLERGMGVLAKHGLGGAAGLRTWINQTSQLTTHQERLAASIEMFGLRGGDMVKMLAGGTAALDESQRAAERLGWALSDSAAIGVTNALNSFKKMRLAISGIFANVAVEIAPYLELLATKFTNMMTAGGRAQSWGKMMADAVVGGMKRVVDGIQKFVGVGLELFADLKGALHSFRDSFAAQGMGLGYKDQAAWGAAQIGVMQARDAASRFRHGPKWSASINTSIGDILGQTKEQADARADARTGDFLGNMTRIGKGILGGAASSMVDSYKQMFQRAMASPAGIGLGLQFKWLQAMNFGFGAKSPQQQQLQGVPAGVQSLAAQDPLSREGFSQRVRTLSQGGLSKVQQQQLTAQVKMEKHLADLVRMGNHGGLAPLNLL